MAIHKRLLVLQHGNLVIQLIANLHTELALARDGFPQPVELLVLLGENLRVVCVDLLVVGEGGGLVAVARGRVGIVAVGLVKERGGCGVFVVLIGGCVFGGVGEAD